MKIRSASQADVPAVLPMVRSICELHQTLDPERFAVRPDVLERYGRWLPERALDPRSVFLVAEVDAGDLAAEPGRSGVVAYAVCTVEPEVPIYWVPECGWVHDLYVDPAARRLGIARAMLREITARFTAMNIAQIRLHTASMNDSARAAFAAEGFRPCVVEMLKPLSPSGTGPHAAKA